MRIGINALFFIPRGLAGAGVYATNLVAHLANFDAENEYVLFITREGTGAFATERANFREVCAPIQAIFRPVRILWEQSVLPLQVRRCAVDVLHSLCYISPVTLSCASVVTIPDLSYYFWPQDFSKFATMLLRILVPLSAKRADKVITLSESSKRSIVKVLGITPDKVSVIYLAPHRRFRPINDGILLQKMRRKYNIEDKYILTVASSHPHKNIGSLIQAFNAIIGQYRMEHQLVLVGHARREHLTLVRMVKDLGLKKRVIFTGFVPADDLPALYAAADLFAFPSLYEGFGMPILEAMACGTPVVSSNATSLPEVAGNGALLFDPYNIEEIAETIYKVLTDEIIRSELVAKGLERVKLFSWEKTAQITLSVYKEVYSAKKG
jgi:glycosyltransferase involved in cell wall biosynthesis